jgi:hypothetical protein
MTHVLAEAVKNINNAAVEIHNCLDV